MAAAERGPTEVEGGTNGTHGTYRSADFNVERETVPRQRQQYEQSLLL